MSRPGLSDDDLRAAYYCAAEVLRGRRLRGQPVPAWLAALVGRLDDEVRASRARHEFDGEEQQLESEAWIGSAEVAALLGWSRRQVQRRAADLDGRLIGGRWFFREGVVIDYSESRET